MHIQKLYDEHDIATKNKQNKQILDMSKMIAHYILNLLETTDSHHNKYHDISPKDI